MRGGSRAKTWRVLKSWYEGAVSQVRLDRVLSGEFEIKRGVKQGSVLSPTLFLLIMKTLLQTSGLGLTINSFYAGGFAHADNIRMLATTGETLETQVGLMRQFWLQSSCVRMSRSVRRLFLMATEEELIWEVTWRWKLL